MRIEEIHVLIEENFFLNNSFKRILDLNEHEFIYILEVVIHFYPNT